MSCGPLLDSCITDAMNESIGLMLIDTFKIQGFTPTADGSGGVTQTWSDITIGIRGFFSPSQFRSVESVIGASQQAERRWTILLDSNTVVEEANRLVQTHSSGTAISPMRTFKILTVFAGDTMPSPVTCECVELPNLQ